MRIKIGKMDANFGVLLLGDGKGNFKYVDQLNTGLNISGPVREIIEISDNNGVKTLMLGINNQYPIFLKY